MSERVGFTGTRKGMTEPQRAAFAAWLGSKDKGAFDHGDCVGADEQAHEVAHGLGWAISTHPGDTPTLRAHCRASVIFPIKANLARNSDIVEAATVMAAAPEGPETLRSGTWSTIRKARRAGKSPVIFWPDGSVTHEPAA